MLLHIKLDGFVHMLKSLISPLAANDVGDSDGIYTSMLRSSPVLINVYLYKGSRSRVAS